MTEKSKIIKQFLRDLDCKEGTGNGIGYGSVEKLKQFAIREGYVKEEKQITQS